MAAKMDPFALRSTLAVNAIMQALVSHMTEETAAALDAIDLAQKQLDALLDLIEAGP